MREDKILSPSFFDLQFWVESVENTTARGLAPKARWRFVCRATGLGACVGGRIPQNARISRNGACAVTTVPRSWWGTGSALERVPVCARSVARVANRQRLPNLRMAAAPVVVRGSHWNPKAIRTRPHRARSIRRDFKKFIFDQSEFVDPIFRTSHTRRPRNGLPRCRSAGPSRAGLEIVEARPLRSTSRRELHLSTTNRGYYHGRT